MGRLKMIGEKFGKNIAEWVDWNLSDTEIEEATFKSYTDSQNIFDLLLVTTEKGEKYLYNVSSQEYIENPNLKELYNFKEIII